MTWKLYLAAAGVGLLLNATGTVPASAQTTTASSTVATSTISLPVASSTGTTSTSTALVTEGEPTFSSIVPAYEQRELTEAERRRVTNLAANLSNYYDALTARLAQITDRTERRIARFDTTGYDLTPAAEQVQVAKAALRNATETMTDIDVAVHDVVTNAAPLSAWQDTKMTYQTTHAQLTTAKAALLEAAHRIRSITSVPINSETRPLETPDHF